LNICQRNIVFLLFLISLSLFSQQGFGQVSSENSSDSSKVLVHSPSKAAIMSAILPGLGQAYNRKYWKIPIVYVGVATLGYFIKFNHDQYQSYKNQYIAESELDQPNVGDLARFEANALYFRRNRDLTIVGLAAFWGLNIIDANVDAHFFNYDISPNLSLEARPAYQLTTSGALAPQVYLSLKF